MSYSLIQNNEKNEFGSYIATLKVRHEERIGMKKGLEQKKEIGDEQKEYAVAFEAERFSLMITTNHSHHAPCIIKCLKVHRKYLKKS